jgi:transposase
MLGRNSSEPALFQMVKLDALVPQGHLLRKIDSVVDFSFVHEAVAECYTAGKGRPSVDPELALRMMLLGELYDLSDRELCDEISMHAGFRWFCRLNFHDAVPDHSTLSRLRNERWAESGLWERLRDRVLEQCAEAGLLSGRHLSVDGTEMAANASIKSLRRRGPHPEKGDDDDSPPGSDPPAGKEPQPSSAWRGHGERYSNETHRSSTDPDARLFRKGDAREAKLRYLIHDLIDTKSRVILRRKASLATTAAERECAGKMLDEVLGDRARIVLPKKSEILSGDTGYGSGAFLADVIDRGLTPHIPLLAGKKMETVPTYVRGTTNIERLRKRKEKVRIIEARNRAREEHKTRGYLVSRKLRIRNEHLFAEAKNEHGLGRARRRGLSKVQVQAEASAIVQNLKRLAAYVHRRRRGAAQAALAASWGHRSSSFQGFGHHIRRLTISIRARIRQLRRAYGVDAWPGSPPMLASSTGF